MTKKLILPALVLVFAALCTTNGIAQTCANFTGNNVQYMGVGSSAQFNSFSFAAEALLTAGANGVNFWNGSVPILDNRTGTSALADTANVWIAWDNATDCKLYAYFQVDSTVGVKSFFSWQKVTNGTGVVNADSAAEFVKPGTTFNSCTVGTTNQPGQPFCTVATPPMVIQTWMETQPQPGCKIGLSGCTAATIGALPRPYCGQNSTVQTIAKYCFFNAGHADIRPEDTLYANNRALSAYSSTNGLTGLGYDEIGTGGSSTNGCGAVSTTIGCGFYGSFGDSKVFNTIKFALSGVDPITAAALPVYRTLNVGASPVMVIVSNADSSGLGATTGNNYNITNVNRQVLAGIENGTFSCVGDLIPDGSGPGNPLQVIHRESLSGTYNTFEFNGVRTIYGSNSTSYTEHTKSATTWFTNDDAGQELDNNPETNYNTGTDGCSPTTQHPSGTCGDPLFKTAGACGSNGSAVHLRAIGTGDMVKAVSNVLSAAVPTNDAFGYTFWGYGNVTKMASGCGTNSGVVTCTSYNAHYLTVDGIDPLFTTPGGANDPTPNPNGAYNAPQCFLGGNGPACGGVPFTHIYDGSYPIWTILRLVTFNTVTTGTAQQTTPAGVISMLAEAEKAAGDQTKNIDDFVPYLTNIGSYSPPDSAGDLNLFVMRTHFKQTGATINPVDGIAPCKGTYTDIPITGAPGTCTVDAGNDLGGAVVTVNAVADFDADFGTLFTGEDGYEYFGLKQ